MFQAHIQEEKASTASKHSGDVGHVCWPGASPPWQS
jgi:hypothetical protein